MATKPAIIRAKKVAALNAPDEYRLIRRVINKIQRKTEAELRLFETDIVKQDVFRPALAKAFADIASQELTRRNKK